MVLGKTRSLNRRHGRRSQKLPQCCDSRILSHSAPSAATTTTTTATVAAKMPPSFSKPDTDENFNFKKLNLCFNKYRKARNRYIRCYVRWRDNRRANVTNIRLLIIALEQTRHDCNITSLSGALGGFVGGVLTGVGIITMPFSRKYAQWVFVKVRLHWTKTNAILRFIYTGQKRTRFLFFDICRCSM